MADDLTRPYIGYRSAGRRPERAQDRRAAADAPLAALRGMVSGVLGAPGDVESLVRLLPGLSEETVLPTSEDVERRLPLRSVSETPAGRAFTTIGQIGGGGYMGPGSPLRAVAALPSAVRRAAQDFAVAAGQPAVNVVKPKGGNWLQGSIERAIEPMKVTDRMIGGRRSPEELMDEMRATYTPEAMERLSPETVAHVNRAFADLEPKVALNKWLDKKLRDYIRNEMATPEDPIRALAERGVLHYDPHLTGYNVEGTRVNAGFPKEGMAQSDLAKRWEKITDTFFTPLQASDITRRYPDIVEKNPWVLKVPPETKVHQLVGDVGEELGMQHLVDELKNAINPASGLPENLRWKYQDLDKVTVPQAVERVAKINAWRSVQKAEADAARAGNAATQVFKEYPEQGMRWVELRKPESTGKKTTVGRSELDELGMGVDDATLREVAEEMAFDEGLVQGTRAFDEFVEDTMRAHNTKVLVEVDESVKILEDALKYEGEVMGHCVGGYCPDVIEGRSRIFSLRDKKGQPHVTIEVKPNTQDIPDKEYLRFYQQAAEQLGMKPPRNWDDMPEEGYSELDKLARKLGMEYKASVPENIIQIKGKANRAPKEEYLPFVQDFVRSQKWGRVGDLENTGLIRIDPESDLAAAFSKINRPNPGYVTQDELTNLLKWYRGEGELPQGFAAGGLVGLHQRYQAGGVVKAAKKTARTLGDLVDEYVRKVRKIEELPEPSYSVTVERPTSAEVPGWHITTDLPGILETGAMTNRNVGARNLQGYAPEHVGGAYFYADPRLARMKRDELLDMVEMDALYAAELPILRAQLRQANRLVPDEDVGLSIPWQQSYSEGSFATRRPVLLNQIDRIYSSDPGVTKDMIRDTIIRQRRKGYAQGGAVSATPQSSAIPYDEAKIDALASALTA